MDKKIEDEQPHVSNPLRYARKTMQIMKENTEDCSIYSFMLHIGLANRYIEDSFFGKQINKEQLTVMYDELSDIVKEFNNKCNCVCDKRI